jgi:hypothetical protein
MRETGIFKWKTKCQLIYKTKFAQNENACNSSVITNVIVKEPCNRPSVAQRVPGGLDSQIS